MSVSKVVVVVPFSNSTIRDWPLSHYETLIVRLSQTIECGIVLLGAAEHTANLESLRERLNAFGISDVAVQAGRSLVEVAEILHAANHVIGNNSGIAHFAAALSRPQTVLFSASHAVDRWGPRGSNVVVIQAEIRCEGCGLDQRNLCPIGHLCMTQISPEFVLDAVLCQLA